MCDAIATALAVSGIEFTLPRIKASAPARPSPAPEGGQGVTPKDPPTPDVELPQEYVASQMAFLQGGAFHQAASGGYTAASPASGGSGHGPRGSMRSLRSHAALLDLSTARISQGT